jgi:HAD superfamily hydrolase (TIGR01450 family)
MPTFDQAFRNKKIVFLDLDGTVYIGNALLPRAKDFLDCLSKKNIFTYFLSNNSSRSKRDYVKKLANLGISSNEDRIILSTDGVIEYLLEKRAKKVYIVGTESMKEMFLQAGLEVDSPMPQYIVLGYDTELTYEKLKKAALFIQKGIRLIATHPDLVCPSPEGFIPDTGSMLALLEKATRKKPIKIFGKPNPEMVAHIMKKHDVLSQEVVMIGDRIYTDMELARNIPCDFVLVLSGETKRKDISNLKEQPFLVVENIGSLIG